MGLKRITKRYEMQEIMATPNCKQSYDLE